MHSKWRLRSRTISNIYGLAKEDRVQEGPESTQNGVEVHLNRLVQFLPVGESERVQICRPNYPFGVGHWIALPGPETREAEFRGHFLTREALDPFLALGREQDRAIAQVNVANVMRTGESPGRG